MSNSGLAAVGNNLLLTEHRHTGRESVVGKFAESLISIALWTCFKKVVVVRWEKGESVCLVWSGLGCVRLVAEIQ